MPEKNYNSNGKRKSIPLVYVILLFVIFIGIYLWFRSDSEITNDRTGNQKTQSPKDQSLQYTQSIPQEKMVDFDKVDNNDKLKERKDEYGLDKGVDAIVKLDESIKVGESVIPMKDILEQINLKRGGVIEEELSDKPLEKLPETKDLSEKTDYSFGIYVVKPNDNLWNIHFRFLKEYFGKKNISLSAWADKPDSQGFSSGVGKILKFSEKIVYIYNTIERKLDVDLDLIHPESKIVVFHMAEILSLLDQIGLENVNTIRYDGENLWIPAES